MSVIIDKPSEFSDNRAIFSYLYQAMEQIENALNHITTDQVVGIENIGSGNNQQSQAVDQNIRNELNSQVSGLKSLIIKTADSIRAEHDESMTDLKSSYVAQSEFGEYRENISNRITESAEGLRQDISLMENTISGKADQAAFEAYKTELEGYIHIGLIVLPDGTRRPGVAIGTDIREEKTVDADGNETVILHDIPQAAAFTSERLSFFLNNAEVAYISNGQLYITDARVTKNLRLGDVTMTGKTGGILDFKYVEVSGDADSRLRVRSNLW